MVVDVEVSRSFPVNSWGASGAKLLSKLLANRTIAISVVQSKLAVYLIISYYTALKCNHKAPQQPLFHIHTFFKERNFPVRGIQPLRHFNHLNCAPKSRVQSLTRYIQELQAANMRSKGSQMVAPPSGSGCCSKPHSFNAATFSPTDSLTYLLTHSYTHPRSYLSPL